MLQMSFWDFLGHIVNVSSGIYILIAISRTKVNIKKYKFIISSAVLIFLSILNYYYCFNYTRFFVSSFLMYLFCRVILNKKVSDSLTTTFIEQLIMFIAEIIISTIIVILLKCNLDLILKTMMGTFFANILISSSAIILSKMENVLNLYEKIKRLIDKIPTKYLSLSFSLLIMTLGLLNTTVYFGKNLMYILSTNIVFIVIYTYILWLSLKEKDKNIKFKAENTMLMNNLNDYEKMLDYQRVANHENKNQLLVIKSMVEKKDKKTIEYIDEVIKDKRSDNETLLSQAKKIPTGGLQGIVYQKMLLMEENSIKVKLDVDNNIRSLKLEYIDSKLNYDLCRIMGIILDNAIEESKNNDKKSILLSFYSIDNQLVIEVSNYFNELPDMSKIENKGYTTKGEGHGYGLSLVREIIEKDDKICNEINIVKNIFCQRLKIKM